MGLSKYIFFTVDLIAFPTKVSLRYIFSLFKRNKKIWVFGSWGGLTFSDNTKYLFLYMAKNQKEIDIFWITRNKEIYEELLRLNLPVLYLYSLKGILKCLSAGVQITTHGIYDIAPTFTKGAVHFSLFHASFPLKKMEFDAFDSSLIKTLVQIIRKPFVFELADYSISSSENTRCVISSALKLPKEKIHVLGYPRSDYVEPGNHLITDLNKIRDICDIVKYDNIIYFVPTFRNNPSFDFFDHQFDKEKLIEFLEETNTVVIFRFHPFEYQKVMRYSNIKHDRLIFEAHGVDDPYPLLFRSSILVTDFSSIFADFLLLNRPIIFANFDHDGYLKQERQLYWDYDKVTPGVKVCNWPKLLKELKNVIVNKEDKYETERNIMKKFIYKPAEGLASDRVCKKIKQIMQI